MRSKNIISTIAFISAFAVSAAFASLFTNESLLPNFKRYENRNYSNCRSGDQTCKDILFLLVRDIRNSRERRENYDYSLGDKGNVSERRAETIADYAAASGSMNDENLPADFRAAWREHMNAWRDYSDFLTEVSRNKIEDENFRRLDNRYGYKIDRSYADALKIAQRYGINNLYLY